MSTSSAITQYRQFRRKYKLLVTRKSTGDTVDFSALRIAFSIAKCTTESAGYSQIGITNLNSETAASIKADDTVILEAGYEYGNYGVIFSGTVVQAFSQRNGTENTLILVCSDGDQFLTKTFVMQTIASGSTPADAVTAIMNGTDTASEGLISDTLSDKQYVRGKVMFGKAADYVANIANDAYAQFYIEDGKVNITAAGDYANTQAVELNPTTGLLGEPKQTDDGVSGECLLNPSLKLNSLIRVSSSLITAQTATKDKKPSALSTDGIYKITKLTYTGDTRGDDWQCEFEAAAQSGKTPDALSQGQTSFWR